MTDSQRSTLIRRLEKAGDGKHPLILCRYCGKRIDPDQPFEWIRRKNKTESWWHRHCYYEEANL